MIEPEEVGWLLEELCTSFGYCLRAEDRAVLASNPPETAGEFIEAVIRAEGRDPNMVSRTETVALLNRARGAYGEPGEA